MALPHKQTFCQNLAALWVRKQFLAERMKYLEVPLLPWRFGAQIWGSGDDLTVRVLSTVAELCQVSTPACGLLVMYKKVHSMHYTYGDKWDFF
jgi:hypothetical protein